jgi:hypothetical protein
MKMIKGGRALAAALAGATAYSNDSSAWRPSSVRRWRKQHDAGRSTSNFAVRADDARKVL